MVCVMICVLLVRLDSIVVDIDLRQFNSRTKPNPNPNRNPNRNRNQASTPSARDSLRSCSGEEREHVVGQAHPVFVRNMI